MSKTANQEAQVKNTRNRYDVDEYLDEKITLTNFKGCIKYIARVKWRMAAALGLSVLSSLIALAGPLFIQRALDVSIPNKDMRELFTMAAFVAESRATYHSRHTL